MAMTDMPIVEALKTKMRWHEARQTVLAENVSNADTPGFHGKDLKAPDFSSLVSSSGVTQPSLQPVAIAMTTPGHMNGFEPAGGTEFSDTGKKGDFEVRPNGNSVNLEDEMVKSSENQIDYQAVTSLYQKNLDLIREAIGKK